MLRLSGEDGTTNDSCASGHEATLVIMKICVQPPHDQKQNTKY